MKRKASQPKIRIETHLMPKKTTTKKIDYTKVNDKSKTKGKMTMDTEDDDFDEDFFKSRYNRNLSKAKIGTKPTKLIKNNLAEKPNKTNNKETKRKNKFKDDIDKSELNTINASSKSLCVSLSKINLKTKEIENEDSQSNSASSSDKSYSDENIKFTFDKQIQSLIERKDYGPKRIRLGLCCMNNLLRNQKKSVFCARSIILATFLSKGAPLAMDKALENVKDILKLLIWNKAHHIEVMRVSSDLFPHYTNIYLIPKEHQYTMDFAKEELKKVGDYAKKNNMRLTMHPGQFNVIATQDEKVLKRTIADLQMHADIMDCMGLDGNSIMVIHGGGTYGDKEKTIQRWIENYRNLPDSIKNRLVLENCEKNFSIIDCLRVHKDTGIPVVFDSHHFKCYKKFHPEEKFEDIRVYIKAAIETWVKKGLRPKFHISEQEEEKAVGAHSQLVRKIPEYYLEIPEKYGIGIDLMIEAKGKETAILYLFEKYKKHFLSHIQESELPKDFFAIDEEKMQAKICSRCDFDFDSHSM